jgi:hypothetical protein
MSDVIRYTYYSKVHIARVVVLSKDLNYVLPLCSGNF